MGTMSGVAVASLGTANDIYMVQGFAQSGFSYSTITEAAGGTTYQYVAQCSNRGSCDASTGLCKCFKGYSNDNCDTQNMLAQKVKNVRNFVTHSQPTWGQQPDYSIPDPNLWDP